MWNKIFIERWYVLPLCSALLLIASFHPFNMWPLSFVALVPLGFFVAAFPQRPLKQVFAGGFITGSLFALTLAYFTVVQFRWIAGAYIFIDLVHLSFLPIALLGGVACGSSVFLYRLCYTQSLLFDSLLGAATYTAGEMLLYTLFGGYYFAMLAYTATPLTFLLTFAGIGGAFFVSFLVAWCSTSIVQASIAGPYRIRRFGISCACVCVLLGVMFWAEKYEVRLPGVPLKVISIAIVQVGDSAQVGFGTEQGGKFVFPKLEDRIRTAAQSSPNLLMYPFSPVEGALWSDQKEVFNKKILVASQTSFNTWLEPLVPTSTTVMIWTTLFKQEQFYNEFEFIRGGVLADEYRKRDLFPFIDYTPQWAKRLGFYTTQIDLTPGSTTQLFSLSGVPVFGLLCSEVQQQNLARGDAGSASILISAGSEAVFVDDIASEFSLKAAQFRAAENNIPAVRANVLGPSAIIARDGSVIASMPRGAIGVVRGEVAIYPPHPTLYTRFGNLLMVVFLCILFAIAGLIRLRKNQ